MNVTTSNKRLLALDVMRGITIAGYDLSKYARFLATCVCSPQTCRVDWINSYRSGIPILYVHYGNLHVHLFEKVQFHLQCSRGFKNSQTDRDHFPDWNWHQLAFHSLLPARSLPYRPDSHSRSHATACFGIWSYCHSRFTHEA